MPKPRGFHRRGIAKLVVDGVVHTQKVFLFPVERREIFEQYKKLIKPLQNYHVYSIDVTYDNAIINQYLIKQKMYEDEPVPKKNSRSRSPR